MFSACFSREQEETCCQLIAGLARKEVLTREEWKILLSVRTERTAALLFRTARRIRERFYGKRVFLRGLVEPDIFSGAGNLWENPEYLTEQMLHLVCQEGYQAGFRSFVLQVHPEEKRGADTFLSDFIKQMKTVCPDCAVTLAAGEYPEEMVRMCSEAGADRYLFRSETAGQGCGGLLGLTDPKGEQRKAYLQFLKKDGWQTGVRLTAGSFIRCPERLVEELMFLHSLQPEIVEIVPFVPDCSAVSAEEKRDALEMTLYLMGIMRLLLPRVLLPVSEHLESVISGGRELGLLCGANVLIQNLHSSPGGHGQQPDSNIAEEKMRLRHSVEEIGYEIVAERGDCYGFFA